jgi:hypothetical protein
MGWRGERRRSERQDKDFRQFPHRNLLLNAPRR